MAKYVSLYPKLVLDQDTWRAVLKVSMPTHDPARFERTVAAGITIPIQLPLLKLTAVVELPDAATPTQVATVIRDEILASTGKSFLNSMIDQAEARIANVTTPDPDPVIARQQYLAEFPPNITTILRQRLYEAVFTNHNYPILSWHQHEADGTSLEG